MRLPPKCRRVGTPAVAEVDPRHRFPRYRSLHPDSRPGQSTTLAPAHARSFAGIWRSSPEPVLPCSSCRPRLKPTPIARDHHGPTSRGRVHSHVVPVHLPERGLTVLPPTPPQQVRPTVVGVVVGQLDTRPS